MDISLRSDSPHYCYLMFGAICLYCRCRCWRWMCHPDPPLSSWRWGLPLNVTPTFSFGPVLYPAYCPERSLPLAVHTPADSGNITDIKPKRRYDHLHDRDRSSFSRYLLSSEVQPNHAGTALTCEGQCNATTIDDDLVHLGRHHSIVSLALTAERWR